MLLPENLAEWKKELGLEVYSYCLMTNHVHLIVGANDEVSSIGKLMKRVAGRQTRWMNKLESRSGSLWESRYKISPIDTDGYLLQCCRYVELNPVKARMVKRTDEKQKRGQIYFVLNASELVENGRENEIKGVKMPRRARVIVPGFPHHIVQRGHNRQAVFVEDKDYCYYLENLAEWKKELGLEVYSYCLMTNHVHLIVGANDEVSSIGKLMKRLAGRQTRWMNKLESRSGSLWESRYKISPIDTDGYLLQCCRYVELNPVKARMVKRADEYPWSSYRARIGVETCDWLDRPPSFDALDDNDQGRIERYKAFIDMAEAARTEADFIRAAVERNQLTGESRFVDEVERRTGIRVDFRGRGRPVVE